PNNTELILLWPHGRAAPEPAPVAGYAVQPLPPDRDEGWVAIQQQAVPRYEPSDLYGWLARYRRLVLPQGILVAVDERSGAPVATAGSLATPRSDRFAAGGEIGWVATVPEHRRRGLARWLCALATARLLPDGFSAIFVSTGADMPDALRLYLRLGYLPYLYAADQRQQWARICSALNHPFTPQRWPTC
ncbi:MAG: GNAT family N-acetyltransferase, partial [Caldilineaceae bacterium]|nr:GNAT family N-acetyltransferase [Caldilineaceae bacterium]